MALITPIAELEDEQLNSMKTLEPTAEKQASSVIILDLPGEINNHKVDINTTHPPFEKQTV